MICFHSLKYWYLLQYMRHYIMTFWGCDLLSFFEILIFVTVNSLQILVHSWLWFAFILWNIDICYSSQEWSPSTKTVVICFHSLKYWYLLQFPVLGSVSASSCDLLSFFEILIFVTVLFIFLLVNICCDLLSFFEILIFVTVNQLEQKRKEALWFAFILWNIDICYSK